MTIPDGTVADVIELANDGRGTIDAAVLVTWPDGVRTTVWLKVDASVQAAAGVRERQGAVIRTGAEDVRVP